MMGNPFPTEHLPRSKPDWVAEPSNTFGVGSNGVTIRARWPHSQTMSREQALSLAYWLIASAMPYTKEEIDIADAIKWLLE